MRILFAMSIVGLLSASHVALASQVSCNQVGNSTFCSDGVSSHRVGKTTFYSNGKSCNDVGDSTFCSDGTSSHRVGGTTFHNDGTSCNDVGGSTFCSDGSSSNRVGGSTFYSRGGPRNHRYTESGGASRERLPNKAPKLRMKKVGNTGYFSDGTWMKLSGNRIETSWGAAYSVKCPKGAKILKQCRVKQI